MVVKMFKKILTRKKAPVSNRKYTKKNTKKKSKKVDPRTLCFSAAFLELQHGVLSLAGFSQPLAPFP